MKKGINKQALLYIVLLTLLIIVAAYFLGYKKFANQAETTQANNAVLQTTVDELKVYHINRATYEAEMGPMLTEVAEIMDKYPADIREEDMIMHGVATQMMAEVEFSNINMGDKEIFTTVPVEVVLATNQENLQEEISFVSTKGTYVNELDYENLKKLVQQVFDSKYNVAIDSITYARTSDDEPVLNGTVDLVFYSMLGNGKEYVRPDMRPYENGSSNIFGFLRLDFAEAMKDALGIEDEEGNAANQ